MEAGLLLWVGFNALVLALLVLDLGVFHRRAHAVGIREAAIWSGIWVVLALLFALVVYATGGAQAALQYLTGYVLEKALAVDNIFVFVILFSYFAVPDRYQHRVLFWGILGALVMRGLFIVAGAYAIERWHWIMYVFGVLLLVAGVKMALRREEKRDLAANPLLRFLRRVLPVSEEYHGGSFFVRNGGKRWLATPLFLVLVMVEVSDVIFAVDSIPAIFAITNDPFIVYTSNVFAILGLRAMYFLLAGVVHKFVYLNLGLSVVLAFIGSKMLLVDFVKIPTVVSLAVVAGLVGGSILFSLLRPPRARERRARHGGPQPAFARSSSSVSMRCPVRSLLIRRYSTLCGLAGDGSWMRPRTFTPASASPDSLSGLFVMSSMERTPRSRSMSAAMS